MINTPNPSVTTGELHFQSDVAQHGLDVADISTAFQHEGGHGVADQQA